MNRKIHKKDKNNYKNNNIFQITPSEIAKLIPQIGLYLTPNPTWSDVIDVTERWIRRSVGINSILWKESCHIMGREWTAIAIGLIAIRPSNYFKTSPAAYLQGMLVKHQNGTLDLEKSINKLRINYFRKNLLSDID